MGAPRRDEPYLGSMLTIGVDLAAEPDRTAVALVEWRPERAEVRDVIWGTDDATILAAMKEAGKAGVDCPLGWPEAFVAFVVAHQAGAAPIPQRIADRGWRRPLTMRLTDLVVHEETRLTPLSVSAASPPGAVPVIFVPMKLPCTTFPDAPVEEFSMPMPKWPP